MESTKNHNNKYHNKCLVQYFSDFKFFIQCLWCFQCSDILILILNHILIWSGRLATTELSVILLTTSLTGFAHKYKEKE